MRGVNLIPIERRHAAVRQRRIRRWCCGGGIYVLLLLSICAIVQMGRGGERADALAMSNADQHASTLQRDVIAARAELSRAQVSQEMLMTLADPPDWSLLIAGLPALSGNDAMLREIHLIPQQIADNDGRPCLELRVAGICHSQGSLSSFVQQLQSLGLFNRVELIRSNREPFGNSAGVGFEIHCVIGGDSGGRIQS